MDGAGLFSEELGYQLVEPYAMFSGAFPEGLTTGFQSYTGVTEPEHI